MSSVRLRMLAASAALAVSLYGAAGHASVPQVVSLEGVLQSVSAGPAADGTYKIGFSLYKDATGGVAVWSEPGVSIPVKGGLFTYQLGTTKPLSPATLAGMPAVYLGLSIEADPELPRKLLSSVPFSLRAGMAEGLDCTACVGLGQLDPKILQGYAKSADLAAIATTGAYADLKGAPKLAPVASSGQYGDLTGVPDLKGLASTASLANVAFTGKYVDLSGAPDLSGYAKTAALATVATSGKYSDLSGKPPVGTACGTGLVLRGFLANGNYDCVAALDPNSLPADALAKVSNGLLTDQIDDSVASSNVPVAIPDNKPPGVVDAITWPDYGTAQSVSVSVDLTNSDVSTVKVQLEAPDGTSYVLYDKGNSGTELKSTWTDKSTLVSGTLSTWVGKNPKGIWKLTVIDGAFFNNKQDGTLNAWSLQVKTLSNKKVQALGGFQFFNAASAPVKCEPSQAGYTYYGTTAKALYVCNGSEFYPISLVPFGTQSNPAASCSDMLNKVPGSKDGPYYIVVNGATTQVICDMTTDGGGWTALELEGVGSNPSADATGWSDGTLTNATVGGGAVKVHGVWGGGGGGFKSYNAPPHTQMRVKGRYYSIDSWDGEANGAQMIVDGTLKWSATRVYNAAGSGSGWTTAAFLPAPWGSNSNPNGYWNLESAVGGGGILAHTAATLKLEFRTGIDQPLADESFAYSHIQLWVR